MGFLLLAGPTVEPLVAVERPPEAWGGDGHRVVCRIAWNRLSPRTRQSVEQLLGPEGSRAAFPDACVWADEIRGRIEADPALARFAPYTTAHYVNFEPSSSTLDRRGCTRLSAARETYCILDGIDLVAHAAAGGPSELSRAEALKLLVHLVGDIHQPLHVGYGRDRGGNDVTVNVMGEAGRNLHWVWDTFMVVHGGEEWASLARRLDRSVAPLDEMRWAEMDPTAWAAESYSVTETHAYDDVEQGGYVGQRYFDLNRHTAERRLQMAGVRLAAVLNHLFDPPMRP